MKSIHFPLYTVLLAFAAAAWVTACGIRSRTAAPVSVSSATTPLAYRKDAAAHLYGKNSQRIQQGKMPANLYAVGVLQVEVGPQGEMISTHWLRAPRHAPEVMREIERLVRAADPFPAPVRMGKVTYTDTWLWDKSGNFQLDTLTEGQH
ncbi:MAG: hypothetical protein ACOYNZ_07365 [Rhodoferax sp.]